MTHPKLEELEFLSPEDCYAAGMFAAAWLAARPPLETSDKIDRARTYRDLALTLWSESIPTGGSPLAEDLPIARRSLSCGGHSWEFLAAAPVECHAPGCAYPPECSSSSRP